MILLPFYGLFYSLRCALLGPVDQFYWWFYSQSMYHSTFILLIILLKIYWRSTCMLLMILLPFYWSFWMLVGGRRNQQAQESINKTHVTTSTNASKTSSQWWCRFCWLMAGLANFCWKVCNWLILLVILAPFLLIVHLFYWWFDPHSTDNILLIILL